MNGSALEVPARFTQTPATTSADYLITAPLAELMKKAALIRDSGHGSLQTYSKKVFIPLTRLCRDSCHYCTFAHPPQKNQPAYLSLREILAIAQAGAAAGCTEALFTLGDKPELRYAAARSALADLGHSSTISYLTQACELVLRETGLLPHVNAGVMSEAELRSLRRVSVSQGLMLESIAAHLTEKGGPHHGSPDKVPAVRLEMIRRAGEAQIPFTSGILIGIGETRLERIEALQALKDLHQRYGHIQEIIIQNFRAKPGTRMAAAAEPEFEDLLWTVAVARLIFGPEMNIQAPPNLSAESYPVLIQAGINDWGGISPVTPDHVNPEAPWPHLEKLQAATAAQGKLLTARLPAYPAWCTNAWQDPAVMPPLLRQMDTQGYARMEDWAPGLALPPPPPPRTYHLRPTREVQHIARHAASGARLNETQLASLFAARGADFNYICETANTLRAQINGDTVTYAVNRNINYTNICSYKCQFCGFAKGASHRLRGAAYDLDLPEVVRRATEAWARGATEICMQGGIHPHYTGNTYIELCRAVREALPEMHIHAFSPLEIFQGAATLNITVAELLSRLKLAGLATLPGTAAEILDDEVRATLCPDKLTAAQWLNVMETAHLTGFKTTATIMFGHMEQSRHWARHLLSIRDLQARTGGFTEFVPLPFVHMEAPLYLKGQSRRGPTFREAVLMHAVARLALHPVLTNIQVSWVKMGADGAGACLNAGANDLGGTLMNESISRAAGTTHGQEMPPEAMELLIRSINRQPAQRTTLYAPVPASRVAASLNAPALTPISIDRPKKRQTSVVTA